MLVAALLAGIYLYYASSHSGQHPGPRPGQEPGGLNRPPREEGGGIGGLITTMGTTAVFLGAGSFCWLWFKKKRRSPSMLVRKAGLLLNYVHKWTGWTALVLIAVHGTYFLIYKLHDDKIFSGLAACALLLALAGYGFFIDKVRNKWMRTAHRSLGLLWLPAIVLHAGGSAILAIVLILAVGVLATLLDRMAQQPVMRDNP